MRDLFPFFQTHPDLIYFDSAATSHKPQCVIDATVAAYQTEYATVHRGVYQSSLQMSEKYHETRNATAQFLNARRAEEIVFTKGTTDAINLIASSLSLDTLKKGDEILISEMEHHSNIVPWQMAAKKTGATLRLIPMDERGVLLWENQINPKTKIVSLAHISNVSGTINPIKEIGIAAHQVGAIFIVDGAQAVAHMPVDVQTLDADFYTFSTHKCYGPTGLGILYGKWDLLAAMNPIAGGGDMIGKVDWEETTYQSPPLRFEAGTPNIVGVIGWQAALNFIEQIGRTRCMELGQQLTQQATQQLLTIPTLRILGTAPNKGAIITFSIDGCHPLDVATLLDLKQVALRSGHLCAQPALRKWGLDAALRISFGIYNSLDEIDRFIEKLKKTIHEL